MKFRSHNLLIVPFFYFTCCVLEAQGTKEDYERSANLRKLTANQLSFARVKPNWVEGGKKFWYQRDLPGKKRQFILVHSVDGKKTGIESPKELAAGFLPSRKSSRDGGREIFINFVNRTSSPLELFWIDQSGRQKSFGALDPGKSRKQHTYAKHVWLIRQSKEKRQVFFEGAFDKQDVVISDADLKPEQPVVTKKNPPQSPKAKWKVRIKDHNLFASRLVDGKWSTEIQVTKDGKASHGYTGKIHWSADLQNFVVMKRTPPQQRIVNIVESAPKDQLQPKLKSFQYLKPGDQIAISKPHLFSVAEQKIQKVEVSDKLFSNPWSISDFRWLPDASEFLFLYNQRGHQVMRIVAIDAATGDTRSVIEENSPTFIDYAGKKFSKYLPSTNELIWMSERDGWNHLYLFDVETGKVKNQITSGNWVVRGVDLVNEENRQIWFRTGGIHPDQDPYHIHYCRVDFDGSNLTALTDGDGTHKIEFSPDRESYIDTWSRVDHPPVVELRRSSDGGKVCELERGDWSSLLKTGWQAPERFSAKGRDAKTDIYGVIYRPTGFDLAKKYPVIEKIYAGPHGSYVPKEFRSFHSAQGLAELGFIVVQIDGMGTSHRSKKFHDLAWKNLKDSGFPDRKAWLRAAAKKYPAMDLDRVGIYGGSAGGQSTLAALLWHGDFYKVGVSDCGCHDNRMDKIWWNELWMGWPVDKSYEENSNVGHASRLTGKLLLTVGELDQNVDPASTMQVVNALIKANKDFDMIVVPGAGHGVGESPYMKRRRADFFVRHLHGVEPRQ